MRLPLLLLSCLCAADVAYYQTSVGDQRRIAITCCCPCLCPVQELHDAMRKHIELHFHSELSSDELVLAPYPMAIKKRVLRSGGRQWP